MSSTYEKRHCLAVLVTNEPGILARVAGLFSGRGYNIDSLTVCEVDSAQHLSRMNIITRGSPAVIEQIKAQLGRLVPVVRVDDLTSAGQVLERDLALLRLRPTPEQQTELQALVTKYQARLINYPDGTAIIEIVANPAAIDQLQEQLQAYGLFDVARTGATAISQQPLVAA